jgi:plasmid maintenance system antidote protein VapI
MMNPKVKHPLFDAIIKEFNLNSDADVARFLELAPPHVSRLRHSRYNVSGDTVLRIYDKTGWSIEKIRSYLKESK